MMYTITKDDHKIHSGARFRDLFRIMVAPEKNFVKIIVIYTAATCILNLIIPVTIQMVINNIGVRHLPQPIIIMSLLLLFILTFAGIFQELSHYVVEILRKRLFIRYGAIIIERLTRYHDEQYQKINTPALLNRYFDVLVVQNSMVTFFVDGSAFILQALIGFALLASYHPFFLLFSLFMTGFIIFSWFWTGPKGVAAGSPEADGKYDVVSWMEDIGRTRLLFMSTNSRKYAMHKFTKLIDAWLVVRKNLFDQQIRQSGVLQIVNAAIYSLLIGGGGMLVLKEELTAGQLVAASVVVAIILSNLFRLQNFFTSIYDFSTALDKIAEFYDYPLEKEHTPNNTIEIKKYDITLKNIFLPPNFNLDFTLTEGSKNLIIVKSFSAKNIFLKVLYGQRIVTKGDYIIGGVLVDDIGIANVRSFMTIIKDNRYFNGTIKENLTSFTERQVSLTEINQVIEAVGLKDNITDLPLKLDTLIGPSGHPLSTSQLLSLQFAKALIEKPKYLIVTTDFEKISTAKRQKIFKIITDKNQPWMLIFFSQRAYPANPFDHFYQINRANLMKYANHQELIKDLNSYEQY